MIGRDRNLAAILAVCLGLLPSCTTLQGPTFTPEPAATVDTRGWVQPPPANGTSAAVQPAVQSPYHAAHIGTIHVTEKTEPDSISQTQFPAVPPKRELVPPPVMPPYEVPPVKPKVEAEPVVLPSTETKPKSLEDPPLILALRCYLDNRPAEARNWLNRYEKNTQELLLDLLPLIAGLREGSVNKLDSQQVTVCLAQLNSVASDLRPLADLVIDKMCFCQGIKNYGVYKPLPTDHAFQPGELVELYAEIRNFTSRREDKFHVIQLSSSVEIQDFRGGVVVRTDFLDAKRPNLSLTERHDLFNRYSFSMPNIPPGFYTLQLTIRDVPTGRTATKKVDFQVVAPRPAQDQLP